MFVLCSTVHMVLSSELSLFCVASNLIFQVDISSLKGWHVIELRACTPQNASDSPLTFARAEFYRSHLSDDCIAPGLGGMKSTFKASKGRVRVTY